MLQHTKRTLLTLGGLLSLGLGIVGAFLPLLPTVPFVLLAAFCFAKSSERLHTWLVNHRAFGRIIRDFEAGNGIPRRVKVRAISLLWISMAISAWIVARPMLWGILALVGTCTTIYLWRLPEPTAGDAAKRLESTS
ncbi:MAG: YbaN family protein [Pseudomonadales bacterium]